MKNNKIFIVAILLMAILAIGAVSASEDISDDVSAIEPADEVISDQIDDNLEETDPQEEILEEDGEVKSLTDFKDYVETAESESNVLEINLTNNYKYNPDTDEDVTRVALDGENYRFKTIILDGKGHSVDGGGKDLIMRLGYMMSNVTVKNIIFKNFNRTEEVSSGYRDFINVDARNGKLENLTLENISSSTSGYLIYLQSGFDDDSYAIENCVFKDNNKVKCFMEIARNNVQVNNCNFTNNDATYFISDDQRYADTYCRNIQLNNCNFEGNNATYFINFKAINSQINGCNFTNNDAWGYGYLTNQFGNNSKMSNCIFEDNFIGHDHSRFPVAWFGKLDGDQPTGENISVSKVTFKNNEAIPIRWDALSGNVTDCVFEGNNGTIDNRGNVDRDNGKYDFEVIVYNNTIIGDSDNPYGSGGVVPLDPIGPGGLGGEDGNLFVNITNYGQKQGTIVILLNGTECYNKQETEKPTTLINLEDLNPVKAGELNVVVKYLFDNGEYVLYDDTTFIGYVLEIANSYELAQGVSPHGEVILYITLPNNAEGTLIFSDGYLNRTIPYADGLANYTLKGSDYNEIGNYSFNISLINDPNYPKQSIGYEFQIRPAVDVPLVIAEGEIDYISYDLPDDYEGNLLIYSASEGEDGEYVYELISNESIKGSGNIPLPENLSSYINERGEVWLEINATGVDLYRNEFSIGIMTNNENFTSSIKSNIIDIGEDALINVTSKSTEGAQVYIMIDSNNPSPREIPYNLDASGSLEIPVSNLAVGEHKIKIIIVSMMTGPTYSNNFIVKVGKDPALAIADMEDAVVEGSPATIHITANETFSGPVTVYVNGKEIANITLSNGKADFKIDAAYLKIGENTVKVTSQANDVFFAGSAENSFVVIPKDDGNSTPSGNDTVKVPVKIVAKDYKAYYNKGIYSVKVYGTDGKLAKGVTVVFKINGKKVKTVKTNSKGVAKFKIPAKYVPKAYKISATALGKTVNKKLTIKQVLKLKKVKVKKSAKKLVITATLKEGKKALKGKKITFRFKGKKYVKKTNKKGVAKLVIKKKVLKKLKRGKKVTYKATYIKDTVKRTVRVRR